MRIVPVSDASILEAVDVLHKGGTVVFPTETAYGLGADPRNPRGVEEIFALKGREEGKPLPLIASDQLQVETVAVLPRSGQSLAARWPAALTLVLEAKFPRGESAARAFRRVCAGGTTVGIRVSSSPIARALAQGLGRPVIATSANRSGASLCYDVKAIQESFRTAPQPDLVLDGGSLAVTPPSTVVVFRAGIPIVVRQGEEKVES